MDRARAARASNEWPDVARGARERIHADPADAKAHERLAYDELFANQLALMLGPRQYVASARKGRALAGDGRLRDSVEIALRP